MFLGVLAKICNLQKYLEKDGTDEPVGPEQGKSVAGLGRKALKIKFQNFLRMWWLWGMWWLSG
jgi:hypothetical protein